MNIDKLKLLHCNPDSRANPYDCGAKYFIKFELGSASLPAHKPDIDDDEQSLIFKKDWPNAKLNSNASTRIDESFRDMSKLLPLYGKLTWMLFTFNLKSNKTLD